jgi:rfaE bifunctional protein nucleotidyltransferase chain/domain
LKKKPILDWETELARRTEQQHPGLSELLACKEGEEPAWDPEHQKRIDEYFAKWEIENLEPKSNFADKIVRLDGLERWRRRTKTSKLVVTNGCFDIVHIGHVSYLNEARKFGTKLLVGINNDKSVKQLKGPNRPINNERDRALFLCAFPFVDAVCVFSGKRATKFLDLARPSVYVKGGDYDLSDLYIGERKILEKYKTQIKFANFVEGKSSTGIIDKL